MAAGSGQSGNNPMDENYAQKSMEELNWSSDSMFLGAAIQDYVAIFDMRKILGVQGRPIPPGTTMMG